MPHGANMRGTIILGLVLLAVVSACTRSALAAEEDSSEVLISPDGRWVAYLWSESAYIPMGPEPARVWQTVYVCWAPTTNLETISRRKLGDWGPDKAGHQLLHQAHLVFSPDGSKLAAVAPSALWVGTLAEGTWTKLRLTGEVVSSLRWLDEEWVGYVTLSDRKEGPIERTFWKQRVGQPGEQRVEIHRDGEMQNLTFTIGSGSGEWPQEFWSPDGRYVFFADASDKDAACLMTVSTGEIRKLPREFNLVGVSWSRDSTRVAWLTATTEGEMHMFLQDVQKPDAVDLSGQFREAFAKSHTHSLDPVWTPGGKFIVGSNLQLGGYLIQPEPWTVRRIGKTLGPDQEFPPPVRGQDVEGILVANLRPEPAAVDYEGRILKVLGGGGYSGWTVLPGGKQAVCVMPGNKLVVKALE